MSVLLAALAGATPAFAEEAPSAPYWRLESRPAPTNLPLEESGTPGEGLIVVTAANIGDAAVNGEKTPITITDTLPAGLVATKVEPDRKSTPREQHEPLTCTTTPIECTFEKPLLPYEQLEMIITVKVHEKDPAELENKATVTGGEGPGGEPIPPASLPPSFRGLKVNGNGKETPFGVERFELTPENENFEPDTQAGSQPFQMTSTFDLNETLETFEEGSKTRTAPAAPALTKNLSFKLPPGLIGNPKAVPQCDGVDFGAQVEGPINGCPNDTVVGVATVTLLDPLPPIDYESTVVPVFNLVPAPGEPARFGFSSFHVQVVLDTAVRTGEDYGVTVSVHYASQAVQVLGSRVTFWGVPGDPRHDQSRGWSCFDWGNLEAGCGEELTPQPAAPFLTLPTSCGRLETTVGGDAWNGEELGKHGEALAYEAPELKGCGKEKLPFDPSIEVKPDEHSASTPTGMTVKVNVPQKTTLTAGELAEADIKSTTLKLPPSLQPSAGAANQLDTCGVSEAGFSGGEKDTGSVLENDLQEQSFTPAAATCPNAAKLGTVNIKTPLLPNEFTGAVYLAEQDTNPFASPLVLYLVAEEPASKVLVKLAGEVQIGSTGELTSVFKKTPQAPFESLTLHLFNTERAAQATPAFCGSYPATATFHTWSWEPPATESPPTARESNPSEFEITSGPNGTPCPGAKLPFGPSIKVGPTNSQAAADTPFTLTIGRPDGQQALESIKMELPPGAAALISQVTPCTEAQAETDSCPPESIVGHSTGVSGLGGDPVTLPGTLYLTGALKATGKHGAAPFGLLDVTPATAGPFHLGDVNVLSTININETTTAATVTSEQIPKFVKGVPAQLKALNVTVERPGNEPFEFNPTNCGEELKITGKLAGYEEGSSTISATYPLSNCASLPFAPKLTASVAGQGSKADGTTFAVKIESPGLGQANIHKVDLTIPAALPSRLTTIQKACLEAVFDANPAACDEGSVIGEAIVHTPVFKNPLRGPAYLVSHGGAAFPDVEFVLQGEGVTILLDGKTDIKNGITYSKFETSPDAPFTTFETVFPAGPHSALTPNVPEKEDFNLCKTSLALPTEITGQNGAFISQSTNVVVTGCGGVKGLKEYAATIKKHSTKGSTLTLVVAVPISGRVSVSGSGLRTLRKSFSKKGTYTLKVHLGPKAVATVAHKHRMKVRVHVSLAPTSGKGVPTAVTVTFR